MSTALAIAAVTESLVTLIQENLGASGLGAANVTHYPPDGAGPFPNPGVNIFLYQVTPNTAYRNMDLPTRSADGTTFLRKPQAALDLHYLFTFYGDESNLEQQRLLGAVALALHVNPVLPRSLITTTLSQPGNTYLAGCGLDTQAELIRFTPIVFSLEELSKLWSFLLKIDYILSTAYMASVVLIEQEETVPPPALPVQKVTVAALGAATPVITGVSASPDPARPIIDGAAITLSGTDLSPRGTDLTSEGAIQVLVTGTALTPAPADVSPTAVTVTLTSGQFSAGPQTAQILLSASVGIPPVAHPGTGMMSGIATFVLVPTVGAVAAAPGPVITVPVVPEVQPGQSVVLQLTRQAPGATPRLFNGASPTTPTGTLTFEATGLAAGTYFVQVLVDGALSPLTPYTGAPTGPLVTV